MSDENVTPFPSKDGVTAISIDLSQEEIVCGRCRQYKAVMGLIIDHEHPQEHNDLFGIDLYQLLAVCPYYIQQMQQDQQGPAKNITPFPAP